MGVFVSAADPTIGSVQEGNGVTPRSQGFGHQVLRGGWCGQSGDRGELSRDEFARVLDRPPYVSRVRLHRLDQRGEVRADSIDRAGVTRVCGHVCVMRRPARAPGQQRAGCAPDGNRRQTPSSHPQGPDAEQVFRCSHALSGSSCEPQTNLEPHLTRSKSDADQTQHNERDTSNAGEIARFPYAAENAAACG